MLITVAVFFSLQVAFIVATTNKLWIYSIATKYGIVSKGLSVAYITSWDQREGAAQYCRTELFLMSQAAAALSSDC